MGLLAAMIGGMHASPVLASSVPFVQFQVDGEGAMASAEICRETWELRGQELAFDLLPADTVADTVTCLVLGTEAFQANFSHRLPDWGVGVAMPPGRLIALDYTRLPAVGKTVREVFLHEMVHALLFQAAGPIHLPTWFHEGTAQLYSGEWRFRDTVSLALDGRVPKLERLQGPFPAHAGGADRAYRTSLLAVNRLREQHGPRVVADVLTATQRTGNFEAAFYEVTGRPLTAFSAQFDRDMNLRYGWLVMLTRWPTLFVMMGLVFAIGATAKIVRTRRRLAEMDDEPE